MATVPSIPIPLQPAARSSQSSWHGAGKRPVRPVRPVAGWPLSQAMLFIAVACVLRLAPGPTGTLSYLLLAAYALLGKRQAVVALFLVWLFNTFTHGFGSPPGMAALYRHMVIVASAISVFLLHGSAPPRSRCPTLLATSAILSTLLVVHSCLLSVDPSISVLKAVSFSISLQTLLAGWSSLGDEDRSLAEKQVWGTLATVAVLSALFVNHPIGYMRNGSGFQGLLQHPQMFGPTMAFLAAYLFASWLTTPSTGLIRRGVFFLALAWIYLSQARIGALTFMSAAAAAIAIGPFANAMTRFTRRPRVFGRRLITLSVSMAIMFSLAGPWIVNRMNSFIAKTSEAETLKEAALKSRGFLIDQMMVNVRERPFTGIGFGIDSELDSEQMVVRDPYFGIAIMAPVEKGVMPIALVEELGWPVALLYAPWFAALLIRSVRAGVVPGALCVAAYALNMAEAVFFSPGGMGMLDLSVVAMAATAGPAAAAIRRPGLPRP